MVPFSSLLEFPFWLPSVMNWKYKPKKFSPSLHCFCSECFYHSKEWKQKCSKTEPHLHPYTLSHWKRSQERTVPHLTWHKPPVLGRANQFLPPPWWHLEENLWTPFTCSRNGITWSRSVAEQKLCFPPDGLTSESHFQIRNNPNSSITQRGYRKLRSAWIDLRWYIPISLYEGNWSRRITSSRPCLKN